MARGLSNALDVVQLSERRQPAYKVEVFDVLSSDTFDVGDVVLGTAVPTIVGPRDFTDDVISVSINEVAGDFVGNGIASSAVRLRISSRGSFGCARISPARARPSAGACGRRERRRPS